MSNLDLSDLYTERFDMNSKITKSDGGSSTYYDLPSGARDIDDLIEHKDMNYRVANIFKACYRYGEKAGTSQLYDLKKIIFFAQREVERIEKQAT